MYVLERDPTVAPHEFILKSMSERAPLWRRWLIVCGCRRGLAPLGNGVCRGATYLMWRHGRPAVARRYMYQLWIEAHPVKPVSNPDMSAACACACSGPFGGDEMSIHSAGLGPQSLHEAVAKHMTARMTARSLPSARFKVKTDCLHQDLGRGDRPLTVPASRHMLDGTLLVQQSNKRRVVTCRTNSIRRVGDDLGRVANAGRKHPT